MATWQHGNRAISAKAITNATVDSLKHTLSYQNTEIITDVIQPGLEKLAINDTKRPANVAYENTFKAIAKFAKCISSRQISRDEEDVTAALAGPFTKGGLLVLLLEPLSSHPWSAGVDMVVSQCATLDMLQEGIQAASKQTLSLTDDVSVIDRWPFFPRSGRPEQKLTTLDYLLLDTIHAKEPEVILCMGKVRDCIADSP